MIRLPPSGPGRSLLVALTIALAGCASTVTNIDDPGPPATSIEVVERGWHTDVCLGYDDAGVWIQALARQFPGAQFLCFGFGERQYLLTHDPGVLEMISAIFPSRSALLMTVLRAPPAAAFGASDVVSVKVSASGLEGLKAFVTRSVQTDDAGSPQNLGQGPYEGSMFFAGTPPYDLFYTCNTWTADALRAAGLPVHTRALLSGGVMEDTRRVARLQASMPP